LSFFEELKRRHVVKVAIAYIVVAWLILQISDVILGQIGVPDWMFKFILYLLCIGFPLILLFAWAYDLTPEGLRRTSPSSDSPAGDAGAAEGQGSDVVNAPSRASVAVLPFVNMSGNPENEYFSDGLSEELLNVLAKVSSLKVAARTSSFHFKGHTGDIAEIAQRLGVGSVLEGSVRQSGAHIRITAQLINAHDGYHLWSESYDRELDDIFAVQDEIATSVVTALKAKLLGDDGAHLHAGGTTNPEAFKAYLQGMHFRNRGSDEAALHSAVESYRSAIELDPEYAQAFAGLAAALDQLATNNFADLDQVVEQAQEAANKSIELAPALADGYRVLANISLVYRLDEVAARKSIEAALKLDPGNVRVHISHSIICSAVGEHEASLAAARMAQELDPVSTKANQFLGHALYFARRYDEAISFLRHALELDPHYPRPRYTIGMCLLMQGDVESALKEVKAEPLDWMRFSGLAILLKKLGRSKKADAAMASLVEGYRDNGLYQQAQVHAQWGDFDQSIDALKRAREIGDPGVSQVVVDPLLDPLRGDPRFAELMAAIGFG
jgi:serine/threonine-protein kinase